jgi:hypothetical protein
MFPERREDWGLYYADSYLRLKLPGQDEFTWVYCRNFTNNDEGDFGIQWQTGNQNGWLKLDTAEPNINVDFPECHYYFLDGQAMFLVKRPLRDATKALSSENGRFVNPLIGVVPENFQLELMRQVTFPKVLSLLQKGLSDFPVANALRMLDQHKAFSVPLLKEWCVSLSLVERAQYTLWYRLTPVAHIQDQVIGVFNEPFHQEVQDVFQHMGFAVVNQ